VVCGTSHHQWEDRLTRFILHIGPHKTGTTYIQHTLDALRDVLLERGICVPSIWNAAPGVPSHHRLVRAIRNRDLALIQDQVREIVAQRHRYVVISCEGLSTLTPDQVAQLQQLLGSAAIQVVHYVRRWPERLPSAWQEHVRQGHATKFPAFIVRQTMGYDGFQPLSRKSIVAHERRVECAFVNVGAYGMDASFSEPFRCRPIPGNYKKNWSSQALAWH
jgi:hypothetical protein